MKGVRYLQDVFLRPVDYPTRLAHGLRRSLLESGSFTTPDILCTLTHR